MRQEKKHDPPSVRVCFLEVNCHKVKWDFFKAQYRSKRSIQTNKTYPEVFLHQLLRFFHHTSHNEPLLLLYNRKDGGVFCATFTTVQMHYGFMLGFFCCCCFHLFVMWVGCYGNVDPPSKKKSFG